MFIPAMFLMKRDQQKIKEEEFLKMNAATVGIDNQNYDSQKSTCLQISLGENRKTKHMINKRWFALKYVMVYTYVCYHFVGEAT